MEGKGLRRPQRTVWKQRAADPDVVERLVAEAGLPELEARILAARGISSSEEVRFYQRGGLGDIHSPFLLKGMEKAVGRLVEAAERGEYVVVYGDYDVDGCTSSALLQRVFRSFGMHTDYYIPNRMTEGYGLNAEALGEIAESGAKVIVSVDCGITSVMEAELVQETLGIDLIITDHHTPGDVLPNAYAIINPLQPGCPYPFKSLAGVGVAFNLAIALRARLRERGFFANRPMINLADCLDLVALGTVADVVSLTDVNRIFVRHGLRVLAGTSEPGLVALKEAAGVEGEVKAHHIGFRMGPRINCSGRLDSAGRACDLLLTADKSFAAITAKELNDINEERQKLEQAAQEEIIALLEGGAQHADTRGVVVASEGWHPGVIGIVAGRVAEAFCRPTIVISIKDGIGKGSGRSVGSFHLHNALKECSGLLERFGGHRQAAGLTIREENIPAFAKAFDEVVRRELQADDMAPQVMYDAELDAGDITLELAERIAGMEPFGMGNPEPVFVARRLRIVEKRTLKGKFLKVKFAAGKKTTIDGISFSIADADLGEYADVAFVLDINEWNGCRNVQLKIKDIR